MSLKNRLNDLEKRLRPNDWEIVLLTAEADEETIKRIKADLKPGDKFVQLTWGDNELEE